MIIEVLKFVVLKDIVFDEKNYWIIVKVIFDQFVVVIGKGGKNVCFILCLFGWCLEVEEFKVVFSDFCEVVF